MSDDQQSTNSIDFKERQILQNWYESGTVTKYLHKNKNSNKFFSFLDGPITANNPMGVHHGWGRTYKDVFQRYFNSKGYAQRFQNGFDCQGLWVEVEVEKSLGLKSKKDIENLIPGDKRASIAKFIDMCKERVVHFANIQTEQSKRLGYLMDWEHSYFTMSDMNNYAIWHFLKICHENNWIYRDLDTVPWCVRCGTSISQHEILTEDYKEVTHNSLIFALSLEDNSNQALLVWTTTPWTVPGNVAVAIDPRQEYVLFEVADSSKQYWIAKENLQNSTLIKDFSIKKTVLGQELVGKKYQPIIDARIHVANFEGANSPQLYTVVATDDHILPISATEGTGFVHLAPAAGEEDHKISKIRQLPILEIIDEEGKFLANYNLLAGQNATQKPEIIFDHIKKLSTQNSSNIFAIIPYSHRYPACWRCKTDLVWRMVDEWYIAMDKATIVAKNQADLGKTLRTRLVQSAKQINWNPSFGLERELDWLEKMHDWMISKKRYWGLCLPIWVCNNCHNFEVIGSKSELQSRAIQGWEEFKDKSPHRPQLDEVQIACSKCSGVSVRVSDVGNPWLDAGIVPFSTISAHNSSSEADYFTNREEFEKWFPVDFITESFPGQFKNWFYSLLVMSTVLEGVAPFQNVLGFATCLAEDGRAMHKSWGNSIEFNEGASKIGVDIMRFMYCATNPASPLLFGFKRGEAIKREIYLLLKNSAKYVIDNSKDFSVDLKTKQFSVEIIDRWLQSRLHQSLQNIDESFAKFDSAKVCVILQELLNDFSLWYIRRVRDRLVADDENSKIASIFTMRDFMHQYLKVASIIMPFLSEELFQELNLEETQSVLLQSFPEADQTKIDSKLEKNMTSIREICSIGNRIRKDLSLKLRQPLASVSITLPPANELLQYDGLPDLLELVKNELNVKQVFLNSGKVEDFEIKYDTNLTEELIAEGIARDLIRKIQIERKNQNLQSSQQIRLMIESYPKNMENMIRQKANIAQIVDGESFAIEIVS